MDQKVSYKLVLEATDVIRRNALKTGNVDWDSVDRTIRQSKGKILQESDAYSCINGLLAKLGDNHSFLLTQKMSEERFRSAPVCANKENNFGSITFLWLSEYSRFRRD